MHFALFIPPRPCDPLFSPFLPYEAGDIPEDAHTRLLFARSPSFAERAVGDVRPYG